MAQTALLALSVLMAGSTGEWVSPDRAISIATPNPARFAEMKSPGGTIIAVWVSQEDGVNIGIVQMPNPENLLLSREGLERGFCKEFNGTIISSDQKTLSSVPVYTMLAKGAVQGIDVHAMQAVLTFNGQAYKLMASSPGKDVSQDADVQAVFNSLAVIQPVRTLPTRPQSRTDWFSENVGGTALLILIVLIPVMLLQRRARKKRQAGKPALLEGETDIQKQPTGTHVD